MLSPRSILAKLMLLAVALSWAAQARAVPGYYTGGVGSTTACSTCHTVNSVNTCNGCHGAETGTGFLQTRLERASPSR